MADKLSIYREALRLLGQQRIASLDEPHPSRFTLDDIWDSAVAYLLSQGLWNFAIRSVELSEAEDIEPLFGYDYAFTRPDDWVRTASICNEPTFLTPFEDYEDEGGMWYASVKPLYIRYVSNDTDYGLDIGSWREPFYKTLAAYLAFESNLVIANDKGNRNDLFNLYEKRLKHAKALDAVDERVKRPRPGRLTRSRFNTLTSRRQY